MTKQTTYEKYMERVIQASNSGFPPIAIIIEMRAEIQRINSRCIQKVSELSMNKNPWPRKEAIRAAQECMAILERIINELKKKESLV